MIIYIKRLFNFVQYDVLIFKCRKIFVKSCLKLPVQVQIHSEGMSYTLSNVFLRRNFTSIRNFCNSRVPPLPAPPVEPIFVPMIPIKRLVEVFVLSWRCTIYLR